ncbi:hypothetical protein FVF58_42835 [Paraburkholderia panacisoli]|uniref:Uncharacterized protein n=1 Tax=Paraburkholderia panacisoli TaxID=2603818 RepID=A0A5B0GAV0_9BURK|nr:hypothetical protein [Paraburkholderia panacisoli]KAA0999049.1 hypothetical protein FVF58_42835 [Paraburkholderia panacisoli]
MSVLHKEVEAPPYRIVINAEREYRSGDADPNGGYYARAVITRLDGAPVYKNFVMYQIQRGDVFGDPQGVLRDAEERAREAIANGFPDN